MIVCAIVCGAFTGETNQRGEDVGAPHYVSPGESSLLAIRVHLGFGSLEFQFPEPGKGIENSKDYVVLEI